MGWYYFIPFLAHSLLVFENNQPTSYSLFHLEQSQAPPLQGGGWEEVVENQLQIDNNIWVELQIPPSRH